MKKIFSFLTLAAAILCSGNAWATPGGSGTQADPWTADNATDFKTAIETGGYVKLTGNIDFGTPTGDIMYKITHDVTLDMNGFTLEGDGQYGDEEECTIFYLQGEVYFTMTGAGMYDLSRSEGLGYSFGSSSSSGHIIIDPGKDNKLYFKIGDYFFYYEHLCTVILKGGYFNANYDGLEDYCDPDKYKVEEKEESGTTWYVVSDEVAAKIGDKKYLTLPRAFNAATDGCTITVLASENLGRTSSKGTTCSGSKKASLLVPANVNITLDMNGKSVKADGYADHYMFYVPATSSLTVIGGGTIDYSVNSSKGYMFYFLGNVTVNPGSADLTLKIGKSWGSGTKGNAHFQGGKYNKQITNTSTITYYDSNNYEVVQDGGYYVIKAKNPCTVDGTPYSSLDAAITAAQNSGKPIVLTNNVTYDSDFSANVTVDGATNNYKLTVNKTISAGTFNGEVQAKTISGGTFSGKTKSVNEITGGTFESTCDLTVGSYISAGTFKCEVQANGISGGTFKNVTTSTSDISGGTFEASATAGTTIQGGTFKSSATATTNISGGIFYSTPTGNLYNGYIFVNNSGNTKKLVAKEADVKDGKVIKGLFAKSTELSEFINPTTHIVVTGWYDYVVLKADVDDNNKLYKGIYDFAIGGVFKDNYSGISVKGTVPSSNVSYTYIGKNMAVNSDNKLIAGTFNFDPSEKESATWNGIAAGYRAYGPDSNGEYKIEPTTIVARVNGNYYSSLQDAITEAAKSSSQTVYLMANIVGNFTCNNAINNMKLDLNGHIMSSESGVTLTITNSQELTIVDGSGGNGKISATEMALQISSSITLNDVKIKGATALSVDAGTLTINGGDYDGGLVKSGTGVYTINAGTFTVDPTTAVSPTYPQGITAVKYGKKWVVAEIYLTVTAGNCQNGSVLVNGEQSVTVPANTSVTLTNTPAEDYKFVTYKANGVAISGNTYKPLEDEVEITAEFVAKNYVCQNTTTGKKYEYLSEAVSEAEDSEIINVLKSYAFPESEYEYNGNIAKNFVIRLSSVHSPVIDLCGNTLTLSEENYILVKGKLTLKNGTITGNHNYVVMSEGYVVDAATNKSYITFENLTTNGGFNLLATQAAFTNCNVDASSKAQHAIYLEAGAGAELNSVGNVYSGNYAASNGKAALSPNTGCSFTLYGGFYSSEPTNSWLATDYTKEKVGDLWRVYKEEGTRPSVTLNNIGTICLPMDVEAGNYEGATFYQIAYKDNGKIFFDEVDLLEAGHAYVFEPSVSGDVTYKMSGKVVDAPIAVNGLIGTLVGINTSKVASDKTLTGYYLVNSNKIRLCGDGCSLKANRAYIDMSQVPEKNDVPAPAPGRRRISLNCEQTDTPTELMNVNANANANGKFILNGQFVIVKDGKQFNAQGAQL